MDIVAVVFSAVGGLALFLYGLRTIRYALKRAIRDGWANFSNGSQARPIVAQS